MNKCCLVLFFGLLTSNVHAGDNLSNNASFEGYTGTKKNELNPREIMNLTTALSALGMSPPAALKKGELVLEELVIQEAKPIADGLAELRKFEGSEDFARYNVGGLVEHYEAYLQAVKNIIEEIRQKKDMSEWQVKEKLFLVNKKYSILSE